MPACVNDSRVEQIVRCTDEIERIRQFSKAAESGTDLVGCFIGHMDWVTELHRLIWEEQ